MRVLAVAAILLTACTAAPADLVPPPTIDHAAASLCGDGWLFQRAEDEYAKDAIEQVTRATLTDPCDTYRYFGGYKNSSGQMVYVFEFYLKRSGEDYGVLLSFEINSEGKIDQAEAGI